MREYFTFLARQRRFLLFGLLLTFTSSAGQTYFIGIFGPEIRLSFDLSHTQWGSVYLAGTLLSTAFLPFSGQLIDRIDTRFARMFGNVACRLDTENRDSIL